LTDPRLASYSHVTPDHPSPRRSENRGHEPAQPLVAATAALAVAGSLTAACGSGAKKAGSGAGGSGGVYTSIDANNKITSGAPMNPFAATTNTFIGYDASTGLRQEEPGRPRRPLPGVAASWKREPGKLTVHLQPNAKWSDGTPVTVGDIKTSMAIALTQGSATVGAGFQSQVWTSPASRRSTRTPPRSTRSPARTTCSSSGWF